MAGQTKLLTIAEAAALLNDAVTESALHKARREGKLWAKKIGKPFFTSQAALMEFLECPDTANRPGSISETTSGNGSSETAPPKNGQAIAAASVKRLKTHSLNTSQAADRKSASVLRIRGN